MNVEARLVPFLMGFRTSADFGRFGAFGREVLNFCFWKARQCWLGVRWSSRKGQPSWGCDSSGSMTVISVCFPKGTAQLGFIISSSHL